MKTTIMSAVLSLAIFGMAPQVYADPATIKQVSITDEALPSGFDSRSDAYVILSVHLNGCEHWSSAKVTQTADVIEVAAFASVTMGSQLCPMIVRIVQQEVDLGVLSAGNHKIRFMNQDGTYTEKDVQVE